MTPDPDPPTTVDRSAGRRFTLLDGMLLIAAFAISCGVVRVIRALRMDQSFPAYPSWYFIQIIVTSWLLAFSIALVGSALFVHRGARRDRIRKPGTVAMLMVQLCLGHRAIGLAIQEGSRFLDPGKSLDDRSWVTFYAFYWMASCTGLAILAGWATLLLVGLHRSAPDWLDRSGRAFGWAWVVWGLFVPIIEQLTFMQDVIERYL